MNAKEKMIKYGAGVLSPADLISVVIGGKNADNVAIVGKDCVAVHRYAPELKRSYFYVV